MRPFAIAGLQLDLARENNLARIVEEIRNTKKRLPWVDMMVIGELSLYGAATEDAEPMPGKAELEFCRVAQECGVWLIPGSMFERAGAKIYNASPVIDPAGKVVTRYRKMFPWMPYEQGVTPGDEFCVFDVPNVGRFGLNICFDCWFPEVARTLVWMGAEVIINPSLTNTPDRDVELAIGRATAAMNQCYYFNVNGAGRLGLGRSIVCGPGGEVIYQADANRDIFGVEIDLDVVTRVRERGWHNLSQTLKSFRDSTVVFPPYQAGARSEAFDALGPMQKAGPAATEQDATGERREAPHLRIAKT